MASARRDLALQIEVDVAGFHMIALRINLMNISAGTIFLARVVEPFSSGSGTIFCQSFCRREHNGSSRQDEFEKREKPKSLKCTSTQSSNVFQKSQLPCDTNEMAPDSHTCTGCN